MVTCIIPARFDSSRFPGKLLQPLNSSEVLGMTYSRAVRSNLFRQVIIASGDIKISEYCRERSFDYVETYGNYANGSERVFDAARILQVQDDVVNLQGDQPLFNLEDLKLLLNANVPSSTVRTLIYPVRNALDNLGSNPVHATLNLRNEIITFSRCKIPAGHSTYELFFHIGIYLYTSSILMQVARERVFHDCPWSQTEALEQLNFLCRGVKIHGIFAQNLVPEINTKQDLLDARNYLARGNFYDS
jgi:3-deoxy-manno-octulosonate cytidylyltransferase (CMP-KDO synthetase)